MPSKPPGCGSRPGVILSSSPLLGLGCRDLTMGLGKLR